MQNFASLKSTPIATIALSMGWKPHHCSDSKRCRVLALGDSKIMTYSAPNSGGHYYFRDYNDPVKGGSAIDLVMIYHGKSFNEAVQLLANLPSLQSQPNPSPPFSLPFVKNDEENRQYWLNLYRIAAKTPIDSSNYLTDQRGIDVALLSKYGVTAVTHSGVIFPVFSLNENGKFQLQSTFYRGQKEGRQIKKMSPGKRAGGLWIARPHGQAGDKEVYLFIAEGPIDALSFAQLNPQFFNNKSHFIAATCGNPSVEFLEKLTKIVQKIGVKKVVFLLDNDEAGERWGELLASKLADFCHIFRKPPKEFIDFNDALINYRRYKKTTSQDAP